MIVNWHAHDVLRPFNCVGIGPFTRQIQRAQARNIVFLDLNALGVFSLDRTERRGRGKERPHVVFLDDPPKCARVRRANGLTFENHRGAARDQGPVTDVGMPHDPAHIRRRPEHITLIHIINRFHGPVQRHQMARGRTHNTFGCASGARGI